MHDRKCMTAWPRRCVSTNADSLREIGVGVASVALHPALGHPLGWFVQHPAIPAILQHRSINEQRFHVLFYNLEIVSISDRNTIAKPWAMDEMHDRFIETMALDEMIRSTQENQQKNRTDLRIAGETIRVHFISAKVNHLHAAEQRFLD
jgi:hypothetical protein